MTDADLVRLAIIMRERQRAYFRDRTQANLVSSKQAEADFDKAVVLRAANSREGA